MKWFLAIVSMGIRFFVDRKYAGGRGVQEIFSVVQGSGSYVKLLVERLVRALTR